MPISTIPAAGLSSGVPTRAQLPAGCILQVVNFTYATQETYTNTAFAASGITATITPTSATSRILITGSVNLYCTASMYNIATVYRNNATNLGGTNSGFGQIYGNTGDRFGQVSFTVLDSPATTSATTYTVFRRVNTSTGYLNYNGGDVSTFTLMEVAV
jgi:hypothetical protein